MTSYQYLIGVDGLRLQLGQPSWRLVDCRFDLMRPDKGHEEYRQGHIPGAGYADLDKDLAGPVTEATGRHPLPSPATFARTLGALGIDNDSQVVVYDHSSGAIAARLWWMLKWVGHEQVALLDGGFAAWQRARYAVSNSDESVTALIFRPSPDSMRVISTDELKVCIETGDAPPIIDARDRDRFAGRREPIDAVAGHIPGAVNHPFSESLNACGEWKSPGELREDWSAILGELGELGDQRWVSMCGSGVTACHLVLSSALAGYPQPMLYVGSWSEWIRDPDRLIAADTD